MVKCVGLVFRSKAEGTRRLMSDGTERPYRWHHKAVDEAKRWWMTRDWRRRQNEFKRTGTRYYGNGGTIHSSGYLNVEVFEGKVVAVWVRCQPLPFKQADVEQGRANEMADMMKRHQSVLCGVEVQDA